MEEARAVFDKTQGRCHFCGDPLIFHRRGVAKRMDGAWEIDHVRQRAREGGQDLANKLPACTPCNRLRWHAKGRRIRNILELGLVARREVNNLTSVGEDLIWLRQYRRRSKALRSASGPRKFPADPVASERKQQEQRKLLLQYMRTRGRIGKWFPASELAMAKGVPKWAVRAALDTEFSVNIRLHKGRYEFSARPAKRRWAAESDS